MDNETDSNSSSLTFSIYNADLRLTWIPTLSLRSTFVGLKYLKHFWFSHLGFYHSRRKGKYLKVQRNLIPSIFHFFQLRPSSSSLFHSLQFLLSPSGWILTFHQIFYLSNALVYEQQHSVFTHELANWKCTVAHKDISSCFESSAVFNPSSIFYSIPICSSLYTKSW